MTRKERYQSILDYFRQQTPVVTTELEYRNAFELLVAVVLSAQCTDKRINQVTPSLFAAFPSPSKMAEADAEEIFEYISSVSYPRAKSHHLSEMSRVLVERFQGEVPGTMSELTSLPGVGRKTANVMLAVWFGQPTMAVDTHVYRVSHRLGLVSRNDDTPRKVEDRLVANIPKEDLHNAHHWLLLHGRYICTSLKPHCERCPFESFCPKLLKDSKLS